MPQCMLGYHPPRIRHMHPPGTMHPPKTMLPWDHAPPGTMHPSRPCTPHGTMHPPDHALPHPQDHAPPRPRTPPPPAQSMLGDMVNTRVVCILLECNLVMTYFYMAVGRDMAPRPPPDPLLTFLGNLAKYKLAPPTKLVPFGGNPLQ